jgi:hypothetical protein
MRSAAWQRTALVLVGLVNSTMAAVAQRPASCGGNDSAPAVIIRQRILDWVSQTNRRGFQERRDDLGTGSSWLVSTRAGVQAIARHWRRPGDRPVRSAARHLRGTDRPDRRGWLDRRGP